MSDTLIKTNRTRPENSGRKAKGGGIVRFRASKDVAKILAGLSNKTAFIEEAIREKAAK